MKAQTVSTQEATGRILCSTVFRPGGKKLLAKGHILRDEDVRLLAAEGLQEVWVTELEDGEIGEDEAVLTVSQEIGCGSLEIRPAAGGRANLFATEDCCLLVDEDILRQINGTASIVIATLANFTFARAGQRVATIKSQPFAVRRGELDGTLGILRERGPILQARPVRSPAVGVLYTDPLHADRARVLFEGIVRQRLERFGLQAAYSLAATEEDNAVARSLQHLLRAKPTVILVASTTAPAGPEDVIGRSILQVGCHVERFMAPVEPGNLLLLGYKDDVPIVSAPGCYRSAKPNVVDLILPPMLARYPVTGSEIAALGHGGLLGN